MTHYSAYAKLKSMKKRSTTPVSKLSATRSTLLAAAVLMAAAAPISFFDGSPAAARDFDAEIKAVQKQIDTYNSQAAELSRQADTLKNRVDQLNRDKATIQAKIDLTQAKYDKLVADIKDNEDKIAENQQLLGRIMADMYIDDDISPLEMLASSDNIADFIDRQANRSSIRDSISRTIGEIKDLKKKLEGQRDEAKQNLEDQTNQRNLLAEKQAEQQKLLSDTKGREAAYQELSAKSRAKKDKILEEQAAYMASLIPQGTAVPGDPNKGGYPDHLANSNYYSPVVDQWGMYSRQCVSYTAWKVHQKTGNMPYWGGRGHAWQWGFSGWMHGDGTKASYNTGRWHTSNAEAYGFASGSTPKVDSVAVRNANPGAGDPYGHVAWVEQVSGNKVYISQYNWYNAGGAGWGHYSEMWVDASFFQSYIYF